MTIYKKNKPNTKETSKIKIIEIIEIIENDNYKITIIKNIIIKNKKENK